MAAFRSLKAGIRIGAFGVINKSEILELATQSSLSPSVIGVECFPPTHEMKYTNLPSPLVGRIKSSRL